MRVPIWGCSAAPAAGPSLLEGSLWLAPIDYYWRSVLMAKTNRFVYVVAAIAAINGALFGYDTGIISGALLYIEKDFALSNFLQELVVSGVLVGAVLGAAVGGRLADHLGRRRLILITAGVFFVGAVGMGLAFLLPALSGIVGWIAIGSLMLYIAFFAVGLGPVFWLLISEIYPQEVRGAPMSIASVGNWASNLLVSLTFLSLVGAIGRPFTFWLYAVVGVAAIVFVYFLVPETKGRSLEDIQQLWIKRSGETDSR
jgi:MFS family permease